MTANFGWEKEGLGKTGEVYLVGQDRLMRSRSRFMIENRKAALEQFRAAELPAAALRQIEWQGTVIMAMPVG